MEQMKKRTVRLVQLKMVREKSLLYETRISLADDVIKMVKPLFENCYREMVVVVGVNISNIPTVIHVVGTGCVSQSSVWVGNVFKPLLLSNSVGFILIHNHPGDAMQPSSADRQITEKLKSVGKDLEIDLLDHLILRADAEQYYSFRQHNEM